MNSLVHLSDAQLKARIADLGEELCEETGSRRRAAQDALNAAEVELALRKQSRQHDVFAGHFAPLLREDLAFERKDGDEWESVGDEVVLVDDTRSDSTYLMQCARGDYDYCVDDGASWRWVPLAFGPLQETSPTISGE